MNTDLSIIAVTPTVFLRQHGRQLEQLVRVQVHNPAAQAIAGAVTATGPGGLRSSQVAEFAPGDSTCDLFLPEIAAPCTLDFSLATTAGATAALQVPWIPPRHWTVHVIQNSHHDLGYTSLPSRVLDEHVAWLDASVEMAGDTRRWPDAARFRMVIEQAWSVEYYLRHASRSHAARLLELLRTGQFELTALYGNLTTELCGHETLVRALYPAFKLQREHGIPLVSAEHNDIPGFTWGLSDVLAGAGIRFFCPGLPLYYAWSGQNYPSFWDETALFGYRGMPGAFWWETPSAQRLLLWCNNSGCGGDCRGNLPTLAAKLRQFEEQGYPYAVARWPVIGGARDNSPYILEYAVTIRDWNRQWAWPRLVSSTNAMFYADLTQQVDLSTLPVHRGDMPGQDYPVGATSTAAATAVNRRNHADLPAAEAMTTVASLHVNHPYPQAVLTAAATDLLIHDEHTWGFHFPCGPTAVTEEMEKALSAYRAATWAHDVARKAMASLADVIKTTSDEIHLVVFNPLPRERTAYVTTPLREIDNAGSEMVPISAADDLQGSGYLRGVILNTHWPVHPPAELVAGGFDLVDVVTDAVVPYQILELDSALGPELWAGQRLGLAAGGKRYGNQDRPKGLACTLCFQAGPVPGLGYRTYRLRPRPDRPVFTVGVAVNNNLLENEFWRLELDPATGAVRQWCDKTTGREWIDPSAAHPFGNVIVRTPDGTELPVQFLGTEIVRHGPLCATLCAKFAAPGHPQIERNISLFAGERRCELALSMLKAPDPLLEVLLAFPLSLPDGRFTCDTPLCVYDPARDRLPGAFLNRITVQNWVRVTDGNATMLWSSLDAPVVSLGRLWHSRVSPAHSCIPPASLDQPAQAAAELSGNAIYSVLANNNFGTNFSVSQSGPLLFRYVMTGESRPLDVAACARFGTDAVTPLQTIFMQHSASGILPPVNGYLNVDHPAVQVTAFKRAEDGHGLILRLWNVAATRSETQVTLPGAGVTAARVNSPAEVDSGPDLPCANDVVTVALEPRQVVTVRLRLRVEVEVNILEGKWPHEPEFPFVVSFVERIVDKNNLVMM